jgi:hypothetical protein
MYEFYMYSVNIVHVKFMYWYDLFICIDIMRMMIYPWNMEEGCVSG